MHEYSMKISSLFKGCMAIVGKSFHACHYRSAVGGRGAFVSGRSAWGGFGVWTACSPIWRAQQRLTDSCRQLWPRKPNLWYKILPDRRVSFRLDVLATTES